MSIPWAPAYLTLSFCLPCIWSSLWNTTCSVINWLPFHRAQAVFGGVAPNLNCLSSLSYCRSYHGRTSTMRKRSLCWGQTNPYCSLWCQALSWQLPWWKLVVVKAVRKEDVLCICQDESWASRVLLQWELNFFWHGQIMCLPSYIWGKQVSRQTPTSEAGRHRR